MERIALVTDSSCDLSDELINENSIEIIPLRIIYNNKEYRDRIDITPQEVYDKLNEEVPKTSMPSPQDVLDKFNELKERGFTQCIAITISSGLSGTYDMFKLISEEVTGLKIEIIDSKILSMGLGLIVLEAAKMIKNNMTFEEIADKVRILTTKVKGFFMVDTLEHLRKGGRISGFAAILGTMLNIKPIISVGEDGKYYPYGKARGKKQAVDKMLEPLSEQLNLTKLNVSVLQGMALDEANHMSEIIRNFKNIGKLYISQISPALVVHTGPGLLGIVFCPAE
jgi:DegV family protein with EDD domain